LALKITISFKTHEKDMYDFLMEQLSPSIYLKGLIKAELKKSTSDPKEKPKTNNLFDF
jgi:hypothetical protein